MAKSEEFLALVPAGKIRSVVTHTLRIEQLKSYLAACLNARFWLWIGSELHVWQRLASQSGEISFAEAADIPRFGCETPQPIQFTDLVPVSWTTVHSRWLYKDEHRLDGGYYTAKTIAALIAVNECGYEVKPLKKITDEIFILNRFRRIYATDKASGWPYLSASEVFNFRLFGQALITKDQYGSAIKHLEPHHLANIPVPILPDKDQREIHTHIMHAFALRDEANQLLDEADRMLYEILGLPHVDEHLVPYFHVPDSPRPYSNLVRKPHLKTFCVHASELQDRFDASFHEPIARTTVDLLRKGTYTPIQLCKITDGIFVPLRYRRIYVSKAHGIPFLQGSHFPQIQPYDLKYLSCTQQKGLEGWIIHKGWILITRSGTIGRIGLVSSYQDISYPENGRLSEKVRS